MIGFFFFFILKVFHVGIWTYRAFNINPLIYLFILIIFYLFCFYFNRPILTKDLFLFL